MQGRFLSTILIAATLPVVAACDDDAQIVDPVAALSEPGRYPVGHRQVDISYDALGTDEDRTLPVRIWYPRADDEGAAANYAVAGIVSLDPLFALQAGDIAPGGPFPVVVYSHGSGGDNLLAYPYAEYFASRGWVVVSMAHVGNTAIDQLGDDPLSRVEAAVYRVTDISATLDAIEAGFANIGLSDFADTENVMLFGHSFGAYTTLAAGGAPLDYEALASSCSESDGSCAFIEDPEVQSAIEAGLADPRIDALAPQAPALSSAFEEDAYAQIDLPILLMSGELDQTTTEVAETLPVWNGRDGADDLWLDIPTGAHFTFITICDDLDPGLLATFQPDATNDGCGPDFIPTNEAVPILRDYLIAFAEYHVLGRTEFESFLYLEPASDPRFELEGNANVAPE